MKIEYDPEVDALYIQIREAQAERTEELESGVIVDYDDRGNLIGMEVLNASKRVERLLPAAEAA